MHTAKSNNDRLTGQVDLPSQRQDEGPLGIVETIEALKEVRRRSGYSNFLVAVSKLNRERLQVEDRVKRTRLSNSKKQRLFDRQTGICPWCQESLLIPAYKNEDDHINPNASDFNALTNRCLLHPDCNRKKSSMTVLEQSKHLGKPMTDILASGLEEE